MKPRRLIGRSALLLVVTLRSLGVGSAQVAPGDPAARDFQVWGQAFYEKVPVTPFGLAPDASWQEPIRSAVVRILDTASASVVLTTSTDDAGWFLADVPVPGSYTVQVLSTLPGNRISVADNTRDNLLWSVSASVTSGRGATVRASEQSRAAGAFNILEVMRRAELFVREIDPAVEMPRLTVFWSPGNSSDPRLPGSLAGGTGFDPLRNVVVVVGDRQYDSDEFDDDVLLHEYAHFLAAHLSSYDAPAGGPHGPGDILDPRVAWSEGWANFFSALVRGDATYRDSRGETGRVIELDLESNFPDGNRPGFWSEHSVQALLWDLVDDSEDLAEQVRIDLSAVWIAFTRLADDRFAYLPSFLDALIEGGGAEASEIEQLTRLHLLDYAASGPTWPGAFPRPIEGDVVTGDLNSWTERRTNLARSTHLYAFETSGGAVSIDLTVTGLGSARNSTANDLELRLMDAEGRLLRIANAGGDGEPERIGTFLPNGRYVIEVRSFWRQSSGALDFNSASYRLRVNRP